MLLMDIAPLKGKVFHKVSGKDADPNVEYTCIGVGQNPETGTNYAVGLVFDAPNNRTEIKTEKWSDIQFVGQITP